MQEKNISINNLEQCQKCSICTHVCPVMAINPVYRGPKQSGPDGERYRIKNNIFFDDTLKYCMNCKRCEVVCPSGVRIADIIQSAKSNYGHIRPKLRDRILASTDFMGSLAHPFAPVVNWGLSLTPVKKILDATVGVAAQRSLPKYSATTFETWFRRYMAAEQQQYSRHIAYYHGCYANYNYPQLGKDFVHVMNALGYGVDLIEGERCCGVAKITNGMMDSATKDAKHNLELFRKEIGLGKEIITVSTSCTLTLRDEYSHILGLDNSDVREHISLAEKFIWEAIGEGRVKLAWRKDFKAKAAYHCPCHQEKLGWGFFSMELLKMIPGMELVELESACCGIAGTYGFKKENYIYSQAIGRALFENIAAVDPDFVACECETCKWQIEMSTGYPVKNPISILAEALDLEETARLNREVNNTTAQA